MINFFNSIEQIWSDFWSHAKLPLRSSGSSADNKVIRDTMSELIKEFAVKSDSNDLSKIDDDEDQSEESEHEADARDDLALKKMGHIVQMEKVMHFVLQADFVFYQKLVDFLMPKV